MQEIIAGLVTLMNKVLKYFINIIYHLLCTIDGIVNTVLSILFSPFNLDLSIRFLLWAEVRRIQKEVSDRKIIKDELNIKLESMVDEIKNG